MNLNCKVAILIDGGFFVRQFKAMYKRSPKIADMQPFLDQIMSDVQQLSPPVCTDILFRSIYYDCRPFGEIRTDPAGNQVDFSLHPQYRVASRFQSGLKNFPQMALRLGDLSFDGWRVDVEQPGKYVPDFKQKAVDMKIGLDIAWMASKRTVDKLVLVAGDSDFVSPMKLARKEGILVYLYPMGKSSIKPVMKEHADFVI